MEPARRIGRSVKQAAQATCRTLSKWSWVITLVAVLGYGVYSDVQQRHRDARTCEVMRGGRQGVRNAILAVALESGEASIDVSGSGDRNPDLVEEYRAVLKRRTQEALDALLPSTVCDNGVPVPQPPGG